MEKISKPDLAAGISADSVADGAMLPGTVGDDSVLLIHRGEEWFAVGGECSHYHAPLSEGILVDDTVRCPMHHACFNLRTGEPVRAPALDPIGRWRVEVSQGRVYVREKLDTAPPPARTGARTGGPRRVVIVGGGAAGLCAAEQLRRRGFDGELIMLSADESAPCDRPNLSKDYLQGTAPEAWMPLRAPEFYPEHGIDLRLDTRVTGLDVRQRCVSTAHGATIGFDALLLATGADPVSVEIPGADAAQVCYLRTFADSRAIVAKAAHARRAVIIGSSFIGLEAAAALTARGIEIHVVGRDRVPMARVLGEQLGAFIQSLHESHGVHFHLGASVRGVEGRLVTLSDGSRIDANFIVVGAGVRPSVQLAERAGLAVDRGVLVDEYLQTSAPAVFAAGDIARWPDGYSGERIRVEHWVVAERQGQTAARNMLQRSEKFSAAPFFWSQHYDVAVNYTGHAEQWDEAAIEGSMASRDFAVCYRRAGRLLATATVGRDRRNLESELAIESESAAARIS